MSSPSYTYTGGAAGDDFVPKTYSQLGDMVGKIALQIIRETTGFNPLAKFKKKAPTNGDTIEQAIVKMCAAEAYDASGASALARKNPDLVVKLFNDWTRRKFHHTVDLNVMEKVLSTGKGTGEIASKVVSVLGESDKDEDYTQMKNLLEWGRQDKDGQILKLYGTVAADNNKIDYQEVLVQLKDIVSGMQFSNADFNTAELKRRTKLDDIYILMPYKLKNRISVEELAGVFNLEKTAIEGKIIEVDTESEDISDVDSYVIYIFDQNALVTYNRMYKILNQLNADGDFWNYFLHSEDMYGLSALFDCGYLVVNTETPVTPEE